MIILDESKLTNGTLLMIAQDYKLLDKDFNPMDIESYIEAVVNKFKVEKSNKILYNNSEEK